MEYKVYTCTHVQYYNCFAGCSTSVTKPNYYARQCRPTVLVYSLTVYLLHRIYITQDLIINFQGFFEESVSLNLSMVMMLI